ncbi:MAG TPA: hypothetical protein VFO41_00970 [Alphaproteobacteria bacterium]|nr:hypothetical protein [Alphaproteobacteria bacterium]
MSLGLYDPDRRYRRRVWGTIVRTGFYVATLGVAAAFAYQIGIERMHNRQEQLTEELRGLQRSNATLEQNAIRLEAAARAAQIQYRELLERFEREVPTGQVRELSTLAAERLEDGVPAERIAFFIEAADQVRDCGEPETKRFIVPTPIYQGANTSVGFADGRITVTGMGTNAVDEGGAQQGWFDPAKPVKITFTVIGGEQSETSGELPLHHSVVLGDDEYRFTIAEGERSFVQITADRCAFP